MDSKVFDTSRKVQIIDAEATNSVEAKLLGMDRQGIEWKMIMPNTGRAGYRLHRDSSFTPYRSNILAPLTRHARRAKLPNDAIYSFSKYYRGLVPAVNHFQLRYNIAAVSKYDIIHLEMDGFYKFSSLDHDIRHYTFSESFKPVSLSYLDGYAALAGMHGEMAIYDLKTNKVRHFEKITNENHILNFISIYKEEGKLHILTGANDCFIRIYRMEYLTKPFYEKTLENPVNNCSISPTDTNLVAVCSDQNEVEIIDVRADKTVIKLYGHEDYSFTSDWHPNGLYLATGNQDLTCRVWDIRKYKKELQILQSEIACASNVKFLAGGQYLAFAEGIDFVSIYDFENNCDAYQRIDGFGEISGLTTDSEDNEKLFFGMNLVDYEGVFEYTLKKRSTIKMLEESFL